MKLNERLSNHNNNKATENSSNMCIMNGTFFSHSIKLISSANVYAYKLDNRFNPLCVIIDAAGDRNFVTESFYQSAFVEITPINDQIIFIGNSIQKLICLINFNIISNDSKGIFM